MAELKPFRGWLYNEEVAQSPADQLLCPPYDVLSDAQRREYVAMSPYNAVHVELPDPELGTEKYKAAQQLLTEWQAADVLHLDDEPRFYIYRMGFTDEKGKVRQTSGVFGVLDLQDEKQVLPHEQTTAKDVTDRLSLLQNTRHNLSPIWALCNVEGFAEVLQTPGMPLLRATTPDGVHHRLWRVDQPALVDLIRDAVAKEPVLIADGHHRTEVAKRYADESNAPNDRNVLALITELSANELYVKPIHRVVTGANYQTLCSQAATLGQTKNLNNIDEAEQIIATETALVLTDGNTFTAWYPDDVLSSSLPLQIDSLRTNALLDPLDVTVRYQHGIDETLAITKTEGAIAILQRPVSVEQIAATATSGVRMPPKSTFFAPKPATGMVFRSLDV